MSERVWPRPKLWPIPESTDYTAEPRRLLSGEWKMTHTPPEDFFRKDCDLSGWEDITIPRQVFHREPTEYAFARDFDIPADFTGDILLRFEGANCEARVFVNGVYITSHYGGFVSWDADITKVVRPGTTARVAIGITDRQREICSFHFGGLIRDVYLYTQPSCHLTRVHADTYFDSTYTDSTLVVHTGVTGGNATLRAYLDGALLGEAGAADGEDTDMTFTVPAPRKWDSEHPNLYDLTVEEVVNGKVVETARKRIGFREVKRVENKVFVNGQEVKLHGVCRHDIHPITGRGITHELVEQDVRLFKEANVNFIRTSHYPPRPDFLDLCDQYGIYIEDETNVAFLGQSIHYSMSDPMYTEKFMNTFSEHIERDRSHPCVIIWSMANESFYGDNLRMMNRYARQEDPSRLLIFSYPITMQDDDDRVDVWSVHYADWDTDVACLLDQWKRGYSWPTPNSYPVLHDESTHIPCHDPKDLKRDPGIRNFWGETIRRFWDRIWNREGSLGCSIWAGIDDVWYRPDSNGRGAVWGIFDAWRRKKPEWWHVRKGYSYIKIFADSFTCYGQPRVEIENRFNHTDLSEVTCNWKGAGKEGSFKCPAGAPHERRTLTFPIDLRPGEALDVAFIDSQGYQVNEAHLVHQKNPVRVPAACAGAPAISETGTEYILKGEGNELVLSRATGLIVRGTVNGTTVVTGGPHLQLTGLPLAPWKLDSMNVEALGNCACVTLRGHYGKVAVSFVMRYDVKGILVCDYTVDDMPFNSPHNQAFSECGHDVGGYEEVGVAFDVPATLDNLSWHRDGMWTVYPEWHTDRLEGSCKRSPEKSLQTIFDKPEWDWKDDDREWTPFGKFDRGYRGTVDFRSMKDYIYDAKLSGEDGKGFAALSDGTDSVRCEAGFDPSCVYNDDDPAITYTGNWMRIDTRNRSYNGEHMMCREKGARAKFDFDGTGVIWFGTTDIIAGTAKVYVDGEYRDTVDLGSSVRLSVPRGNEAIYNELLWSVDGLADGKHTLEIEVTGEFGINKENTYVTIDRFCVLRKGYEGPVRFIVDNEFNYPDLTWGCYYKEPILVASGYTRRVTVKLG